LQAKPDKFQVLAVGKKIFIFNILISRVKLLKRSDMF
jgi:hypothetical protein